MEDHREYNTIEAIARAAANDIGMYSTHHYTQFEDWAIRGYRDAYFDFAGKAVPYILEMNSLRVVKLPSWAVDWVKVGVMYGERAIFFGRAGDLALYNASDDCGNLIPNAPRPPIEQRPVGINIGAYIGPAFGAGVQALCTDARWSYSNSASYNGLFVEEGEYPDLRLRFSSEVSDNSQIYSELITDGQHVCGDTYVHPYMFEYVVAYIHHKRVSGNDSSPLGLKGEKKMEMKEQRKIALMRMQSLTPEDLSDALARSFHLGTKR
jgi:hypothetical protein